MYISNLRQLFLPISGLLAISTSIFTVLPYTLVAENLLTIQSYFFQILCKP